MGFGFGYAGEEIALGETPRRMTLDVAGQSVEREDMSLHTHPTSIRYAHRGLLG